jgi:small GTP-binding protein
VKKFLPFDHGRSPRPEDLSLSSLPSHRTQFHLTFNICESHPIAPVSFALQIHRCALRVCMDEASKVVLLGDHNVGKTCIYNFAQKRPFSPRVPMTVGGGCCLVEIQIPGETVKFVLWDTAGSERHRALVPLYFERAAYLILAYDCTDRASFDSIRMWAGMAADRAPKSAKAVLVATKVDLADARAVSGADAEEMQREIEAFAFFETSARLGNGLTEMFEAIGVDSLSLETVPKCDLRADSDTRRHCNCLVYM